MLEYWSMNVSLQKTRLTLGEKISELRDEGNAKIRF